MRRAFIHRGGVLLSSLLLVGVLACSSGPATGGAARSGESTYQVPAAADKSEVVACTYPQFEERIKQLKGKVIVLDCWTFS